MREGLEEDQGAQGLGSRAWQDPHASVVFLSEGRAGKEGFRLRRLPHRAGADVLLNGDPIARLLSTWGSTWVSMPMSQHPRMLRPADAALAGSDARAAMKSQNQTMAKIRTASKR